MHDILDLNHMDEMNRMNYHRLLFPYHQEFHYFQDLKLQKKN